MSRAALLAAIALAVGLVACGGDDEEPQTGGGTAGEERSAPAGAPGGGEDGSGGAGEAPAGQGGEAADDEAATERDEQPSDPPTPGFRDTSGVTDIPAYGVEADEAQRSAAEATLNAYLAARRAGEPREACSYLYGGTRAELASLAEGAGPEARGSGCAAGLRLSQRLVPDPYFGRAQLAALRGEEGPGAFALFQGTDGVDYWVAMRRQPGGWRIISTTPQRLEPEAERP